MTGLLSLVLVARSVAVQRSDEERGHLRSGHDVRGAEHGSSGVAAERDPGFGHGVDVACVSRSSDNVAEPILGDRREPQGPGQEGGHLLPGHQVGRAEQRSFRVAADGDPGRGDVVDGGRVGSIRRPRR